MKQRFSPVVELRQYTLHPGKRDTLIELFDREFIESQEAVGAHLIGQFRDLANPDRFVWLRGFENMEARREALTAFYGGPVWKANREAANATMIDSDNVLLLRPSRPESMFELDPDTRPPRSAATGNGGTEDGIITCVICNLADQSAKEFLAYFERWVMPALEKEGASLLAYFETETTANTFPALPVRENENVFVYFTRRARELGKEMKGEVLPALTGRLRTTPALLRLAPTARSLLRG